MPAPPRVSVVSDLGAKQDGVACDCDNAISRKDQQPCASLLLQVALNSQPANRLIALLEIDQFVHNLTAPNVV
jgi:hypothetical protein